MVKKANTKKLEKSNLEKDFVRYFQDVGNAYHIDSLTMEIVALLYLSKEALSMEIIARKTGYSLASISMKLKPLEDIGYIYKTKEPGSKKAYYSMEKNLTHMIKNKVINLEQVLVTKSMVTIPQIIKKHSKEKDIDMYKIEALKKYLKEIEKLDKMYKELITMLDNMN